MKAPERRKSPRRPVLDSFSMFVTVPTRGVHRLPVYDLSEGGLGFDFDTDGEDITAKPLKIGDKLEVHLYLNQSLYLPLQSKVMRIEIAGTVRRLGVELVDPNSKGHQAYLSFIKVIDQLSDSARIDPATAQT